MFDSLNKVPDSINRDFCCFKYCHYYLIIKKEDKFDKKTYSLVYPSDCISPRLYRILKAHKPEKNYPMRALMPTIRSPPYGTSKFLVKIIQPTLNKNKHRVLNSS